ncbi:peptide/nickel transport system substrate-binding protein [Rhizobiales bacterium GAS188]|nr:peptide/nickel transport system substrate-binding protein [Rhizobiales bacterium GAS188]
MSKMKLAIAACLALAVSMGAPAHAKSIRWASQDDAATMDPHAFNHGMTTTVLQHIYEGLVRRDRDMKIEPALAISWTQPDPKTWRFRLRPDATFQDGTPFSAEDVVFSIKRILSDTSDMKVFAASIADVKAIDPSTVDVITTFPNAALIQSLPEVRIMSKLWCETNKAANPADIKQSKDNFATLHANGTGPFRLVMREPGIRTVLAANDSWWDHTRPDVSEAELVIVPTPATRVAALLSGEVDFAYPIPIQDIGRVNGDANLKVLQGPEIRTMFLAMDVARDELLYSNVKGKNPFKNQRVRQAIYQAIDVDAINTRIMRGSVTPTGSMIAPGINGVDASLQPRAYPYDVEAARQLLADAGYKQGFETTLDCPNDRYVSDERVCQAIVGMLAKLDIKVTLNALTSTHFFPKIGGRDTSFAFFGYSPLNMDAYNTLSVVMHSPKAGNGQWNVGNYSNPDLDGAIDASLSEMDPLRRTAWVTKALSMHRKDVAQIPLYQQGLAWGMRKSIDTPLRTDNNVNLALFKIR